eukprot:TRINITY_DN1805_c0_g1_i4.p1 TRINITY_DN1805_c0_g1~~TRINITY_DN1805_c0_g1_i4.p1  ORF type:complete len:349 (-),score=47.32 TRINITY_DN1805_c0_g1_i4:1436-2482(-)
MGERVCPRGSFTSTICDVRHLHIHAPFSQRFAPAQIWRSTQDYSHIDKFAARSSLPPGIISCQPRGTFHPSDIDLNGIISWYFEVDSHGRIECLVTSPLPVRYIDKIVIVRDALTPPVKRAIEKANLSTSLVIVDSIDASLAWQKSYFKSKTLPPTGSKVSQPVQEFAVSYRNRIKKFKASCTSISSLVHDSCVTLGIREADMCLEYFDVSLKEWVELSSPEELPKETIVKLRLVNQVQFEHGSNPAAPAPAAPSGKDTFTTLSQNPAALAPAASAAASTGKKTTAPPLAATTAAPAEATATNTGSKTPTTARPPLLAAHDPEMKYVPVLQIFQGLPASEKLPRGGSN